MKGRFLIFLAIFTLIFLTLRVFILDRGTLENYRVGFPREESPALTKMMRDIILNGRPLLIEDPSTSIFEEQGIDEENDVLLYGKYDHEKLAKQYMTVQTAHYPGARLEDLIEEQSDFKERVVDPLDYGLPKVKKVENEIMIETKQVDEVLELLSVAKTYDINFSSEVSVSVQSVSENAFYLHLKEEAGDRSNFYHVFIKQDFSDVTIVANDIFAKEDFLSSNKLELYIELFPKVDEKRHYLKAFEGQKLIDIENKELQPKEYYDYLSKDGKFVYVTSDYNSFSKGTQEIQRFADRRLDKKEYYAKFRFSYRNIVNKLNWARIGSAEGKVVYFGEDIIMLHIGYHPFLRNNNGQTNVIIDLQNNKERPDIYLIDLGVFFDV